MKYTCYQIKSDRFIEPASPEPLSVSWFEDETHRWLDVEGAKPDELRQLLEPLRLHPLILEGCTEPGPNSPVAAHEKALYLQVQTVSGAGNLTVTPLSLLCLPTTLITIHVDPIPGLGDIAVNLTGHVRLNSASSSALLYRVLDHSIDRLVPEYINVSRKIDQLAINLDEDPDSIAIDDILPMKQIMAQFSSIIENHLYCVSALNGVDSEAIRIGEQREYFRNLSGRLELGRSAVQRMESRVQGLHQHCLLALQEKTNNRLKILTILSAIFLPSTLVAGIFGMNFENIPALKMEYGYFVALAVMVGLVVGQLCYFYFRGWFK